MPHFQQLWFQFITGSNYVDRQILSLLKPILDQQFGWTSTQFGEIDSVFQGAYGVSLLVFGWLIDRYGVKAAYALSIAVWSLAAIAHAFVFSIGGFFAARVALGLGEDGNFPAAIKATAQWFPKRERAFAASLFISGSNAERSSPRPSCRRLRTRWAGIGRSSSREWPDFFGSVSGGRSSIPRSIPPAWRRASLP